MSSSRPLTIVITGASRGLGAGMARAYLAKGHTLGLCSRSPPQQDFASESNKKRVYYQSNVDVCDPQAIQNFLDNVVNRFGHIDVWINNAGILNPIKPIRNTAFSDFETNIKVNLMGVFHATKAYIHHVRALNSTTASTLVNISSGAAIQGYAGWGGYCSSKAAVDRLTECALLEEEDSKQPQGGCFRAYSVVPGVVDTDMQSTIRNTPVEDFPLVEKFLKIKAEDSFNTPCYVADQIEELALLEGPQTLPVVQRIASEKA